MAEGSRAGRSYWESGGIWKVLWSEWMSEEEREYQHKCPLATHRRMSRQHGIMLPFFNGTMLYQVFCKYGELFYSLINWARSLSPGPLTVLMLPWGAPGARWDEAHGDALPPPPALLLPAPPWYSPSIVSARLTAWMCVCPVTPPGCVCPGVRVCVVGFPGEPGPNNMQSDRFHFLPLKLYDLCLWCPIAPGLSVHDYDVVTICN